MKKISIILGIIIAASTILGAGWKFYDAKADRIQVERLAGSFEAYKLQQYRRYLQERIWSMETRYPKTYTHMPEYKRLIEELKQIDLKINAYYQRNGK